MYKRRQFFIKKKFQSRFILHFCLSILLGGFISTGSVLYFSKGNLTALFQNSNLVVTDTSLFILPAVLYANMITIIILSLSMIVVTLFVSHKIAGPLFRLEKDINLIAEGDLTFKIHLRKGDQLRELSVDINQMTANLNMKVLKIQTGLKQVMISASDMSAPECFLRKLQQLHERLDQNFKLHLPEGE